MSFFKSLGKGLKKVAKGVTKVASHVPGIGGIAASAANAALEGRPVLKSVGGDLVRNSKMAAQLLPMAGGVGALAPALQSLPGVGGLVSKGAALASKSRGLLPPPGDLPGLFDYGGGGAGTAAGAPPRAAPGGLAGVMRGALGGKPVTIGNVTSAITGGAGGLGDVLKLLALAGVTGAGLKAGHDASKAAHELRGRQVGVGNELADFGRQSLASANTFRDAAQGPLLLKLLAGPQSATDMSRFADTRNPYRKRYGGAPMLPPPGGGAGY